MSSNNDLIVWSWFSDMVEERPELVRAANNMLRNIRALKEEE